MSHHSSNPEEDGRLHKAMQEMFGEFPDGKLNPDDAGQLPFLIGVENERVVIQYPKLIAWLGMTPDEAIGMAELLVKHARKCGSKKPLQLHIG